MKWSEISKNRPELRDSYRNALQERKDYFDRLMEESSRNANRYLFLINAGGAAAVLSFMTSGEVRAMLAPKISLGLFLLGLILLGCFLAWTYHRMAHLAETCADSNNDFLSDKINYEQWRLDDTKRISKGLILGNTLCYLSFLSFILGAIIGVISLICHG